MNCNETRENPEIDVIQLGSYSLALTVINILCIFLTGWLVLWIKAVTPERVPQYFALFCRRDIPNNRTSVSVGDDLDQIIVEEARDEFGIENSKTYQDKTFIETIREKIEKEEDYLRIRELQRSTSNITALTRNDFQIILPLFEKHKRDVKISLIPEDFRRLSMPSEPNRVSQLTSRPSTWSSLDTKLNHQAEVLATNSRDSLGSRQVALDTIASDETQMTNNKAKYTG